MRLELFSSKSVSPLAEMGAYEALWMDKSASFKRIADLTKRGYLLPSELVPASTASEFAARAREHLSRAGVLRYGVRVQGTPDYPDRLRDARHPLALLYFQGNWELVSSPCVAVVGTRSPSNAGLARTRKLVRLLVGNDFTVVSGLAKGVDTAAHRAAIEAGGRTIAVIGTPLSSAHPRGNAELQRQIAKEFLLISQVPICRHQTQAPPTNRYFFPERNVTMSAISEATVIVEAGETSGTLTQARAALHQGRKLFILESCFQNAALSWPRRLESRGGIRVKHFAQIAEHLGYASHRD